MTTTRPTSEQAGVLRRRFSGPLGGRRRTAWIVGAAIAMVLAVALATAVASPSGQVSSDPDAELRAACAVQAATMPAAQQSQAPPSAAAPPSPFARGPLWTPPYPQAEQAAKSADSAGQPERAARLRKLAQQPRAVWFTDAAVTPKILSSQVAATVRGAVSKQQVAVLVAYGIPLRDCGGASTGGASSGTAYTAWIEAFTAGLRAGGASSGPGVAVVLEPDALGQLDRLPADRQTQRTELLRAATQQLAPVEGVAVYLDAGHSGWVPAAEMVRRLSAAGVAAARGFSLNVSNYRRTEDEIGYGRQISPQLGWKTFVVDTSRNGNGPAPAEEWCNPPGRALGPAPQTAPTSLVDSYLWVKPPGESDGSCRAGQPPAGQFWPDYADELVRNANW